MSLFEIEINSQLINNRLKEPLSTKLKLLYLAGFLDDLTLHYSESRYLSYFIEYEHPISELILKREFDFFSPDELDVVIRVVHSYLALERFDSKLPELQNLIMVLTEVKERIVSFLNGETRLIASGPSQKESYPDSANVVLLENDELHHNCFNSGIIQRLKIQASLRSKKGGLDKIEFLNLFEFDDSRIVEHLSEIVAIAKEEYGKIKHTGHSYNFSFGFEKKEFVYSGTSMGAAAISLAYNTILRSELHKTYYKFREDVVFTSEIDKSGNLIELDDNTLRAKLKTVFFSRYNKFVLPEDNLQSAKNELAELNKIYPHRKLVVIPAASFQSIFKNLDIVEICRLKLTEKVKNNLKRYGVSLTWSLSLIALLLIAFIVINYFIPHMDRNMVNFKIEDQKYKAYNQYGIEVWQSEYLSPGVIARFEEEMDFRPHIFITDLDNNMKNEVIYFRVDEQNPETGKTLYCYNQDNTLMWKSIIPAKDSLYGSDYCYNRISLDYFRVVPDRETNKKYIIASYRVCELYPYYTALLSGKGEYISDFYHPGYLTFILFFDIDGDGQDDIVQGGVNNDLDHRPVLIVFDQNLISGCAPGNRFPSDYKKGLCKYYILLPKSPVNKFTFNQHAETHRAVVSENTFAVYTRESLKNTDDAEHLSGPNSFSFIYTFSKDMQISEISSSSEFDVILANLIKAGKMDKNSDWLDIKNDLKSQIRWWDGDKFVNYPVINKYYLAAKDSIENKQMN